MKEIENRSERSETTEIFRISKKERKWKGEMIKKNSMRKFSNTDSY